MYNIMNNSKTAMKASQLKIDVISNNITNVQTTGYKKLEVGFVDLYTQSLERDSYPHSGNNAITGTGVKASQAIRNLSQGALKHTEIKTDLAIDGEGFFRLIRPNGEYAYTRNGEFNLDVNGQLVDTNGNLVEINFNNGMSYNNVNLSDGELSINKYGEVFLNDENIGKIELYKPQGDNSFTSIGDGLFISRDNTQLSIVNNSSIHQGYVETSNVDLQNEIADLILVQRAFQSNSRAMQSTESMWGMINNLQSR